MSSTYGIAYSPASVPKYTAPTVEVLWRNIKYIRLTWLDFTNVLRNRVIPYAHFTALLKSDRPGITVTKCALGLVFITAAPGFGGLGEYLYVPDLDTLRLCPYQDGHAMVMGTFREKEPKAGPNGELSFDCALCPRSLLRRVLEYAAEEAATTFLVGFETEFVLLKSTHPVEATNDRGWSTAAALLPYSVEAQILEEIVESLTAASITVEMFHAEAAPGQYEIVTGPLPPLEAVDALVFTRETIVNVAAKHGLRATLAPRLFNDNCGNGAHAHISLHSTEPKEPDHPSTDGPETGTVLTESESSFLAGVLAHLPALCALSLPTPASYARVADGVWSGGTYVCWGTDNREAPLRVCGARGRRHFEYRPLDGTACPYVALAGVLGVGARAIHARTQLAIQECSERVAAEMDAKDRAALGIDDAQRVPRSIAEARERLVKDPEVMEVLGEIGKVWVGINETLEKCLDAEARKFGTQYKSGDYACQPYSRVMVETY